MSGAQKAERGKSETIVNRNSWNDLEFVRRIQGVFERLLVLQSNGVRETRWPGGYCPREECVVDGIHSELHRIVRSNKVLKISFEVEIFDPRGDFILIRGRSHGVRVGVVAEGQRCVGEELFPENMVPPGCCGGIPPIEPDHIRVIEIVSFSPSL